MRIIGVLLAAISVVAVGYAQSFEDDYNRFKEEMTSKYSSFRDKCNAAYTNHLRSAWDWFEGKSPLPRPKEDNPVPPQPYEENDNENQKSPK